MQIKTGTASVTNGSNIVTASAGVSWSGITAQAIFSLDQILGAPLYPLSGPAYLSGGFWRLPLAVPYAQATNAAALYLIQKDFETVTVDGVNYDFALFDVTDTQTLPLINRNTLMLANFLRAVLIRPTYLWNADQSKFFPIQAFGATPGEETIGISGPGVP